MTRSRYEKNVFLQPALIREILAAPEPGWLSDLRARRVLFVGIGTSYFAAQIAKCLWRGHVSADAEAAASFDFVRLPQPVRAGDAVALFSHSGAKSFTVEAAEAARAAGAVTAGLTCIGSPWTGSLTHRLETCEREDTGAFTKSLTTALAWIVRATGDRNLIDGVGAACGALETGPALPAVGPQEDVIIVGDVIREWVAREIALKLQEAAYLRARAFGLEEFLHGPRLSAGPGSVVVALTDKREPRWETLRAYLRTIEVPMVEAEASAFDVPGPGAWLAQLFWGQRLTLAACLQSGIDPDSLRTHEPRYKAAREKLSL